MCRTVVTKVRATASKCHPFSVLAKRADLRHWRETPKPHKYRTYMHGPNELERKAT